MAIAVNPLTSGSSTSNATSYSTASVTPTADALVLICFQFRRTAIPLNTPTVTGCNLTWVQVENATSTTLNARKIYMYRALGSSPTAGAITMDASGETQDHCIWSVFELTGVDTSGTNGSGAIVQDTENSVSQGDATSGTLTLSAFGSANNYAVGFFAHYANEATTEGSGFTEIHDVTFSESATGLFTEYKANDTTVDASWVSNTDWLGIAAEIKAASAATEPGQVTGLSATASSSTVISLTWSEPSDGGSPITGYFIERESPVGGGWGTLVANTGTTTTSYSNTGLTDATEYNYRVSAINAIGTGTASTADSATTGAVQTTFYFSTSGNDTTGDGTSATPWRLFSAKKAGNGALNPGDICYFKRGDVWEGSEASVVVNSNGTSSNPIILDAYGSGDDPVFAGASVTTVGWSVHSGAIYKISGQTQKFIKTVVQGTDKALGRWRGLVSAMPEGTFCRDSNTDGTADSSPSNPHESTYSGDGILYVRCWGDVDPAGASIRIGNYHNTNGTSGNRGLVRTSSSGSYGDYVHFKNLKVLGANHIGFSASGQSDEFFDCTAIGCGQEGILFYSELAGSGESADGGRWWRGEIAYNAASGTSYGQGATSYASNVWFVGSTTDYCYIHDNFMAGIDFLESSATQHNCTQNGAVWCKVIDNGRWQDSSTSFDPGIYVDGANRIYIYGCIVSGSGTVTGATGSRAGILFGSENLPGNITTDVYIVNNLVYRCHWQGIAGKNLNSTYDNIANVYIINNTVIGYLAGTFDMAWFARDYNTTADNWVMRNNIFIAGTGNNSINLYANYDSFLDSDYNCLYRTNGSANVYDVGGADVSFTNWKLNSGEDANSINANPQLVSLTEADGTIDAHLDPASPCINLGMASPFTLPSWIPTGIFTYEGGAVRGTTLASGVFDDTTSSIDAGFHYSSDQAAPAASSSYTPRCGLLGVG